MQSGSTGPGANLIGTLPPAGLEIARNGNLSLISPRPPAASGDVLVSVEGISCRR